MSAASAARLDDDREVLRGLRWATRRMRGDARVMHRLHEELQAAEVGTRAWHRAGIAFLREGLKRGCLDHLYVLADLIGPHSTLGDRSTDTLFENFDASDAFIAHLRIAAAADSVFEHYLRAHYGDSIFSRELRATHPSHPEYVAPPKPDQAPPRPAPAVPQLAFAFG